MLQSYKQHIGSYYTPSQTKDIDIDALVSFVPITAAKLNFYNRDDASSFAVIVYNWLNLGVNDNPLNNGDSYHAIATFTLAPESSHEVVLNGSIDGGITAYTVHVTKDNNPTAILHIVIEGVVDAAVLVTPPV